MKRSLPLLSLLLGLLLFLVATVVFVASEEEPSSSSYSSSEAAAGESPSPRSENEESKTSTNKPPPVPEDDKDLFDAKNHMDWGSYYDPKNIFCGKYDCYKILGFDYENYGKEKPTTKTITKRYRALSREWHPDKSKHKDAKERFVKIARAYEVLVDIQQRKEYDFLRYNQEAYFRKYGASVLFQYAPKSDTIMVVLLLTIVANYFSWWAQKEKWQRVANRLIQATVEDWTPSQGGTPESKLLRQQALELLANQTANEDEQQQQGKKVIKLTAREKKAKDVEALRPIVEALVHEMKDFGAGFHQPTWKDLLSVRMMYWPIYLSQALWWQSIYLIRRLQKKELNDDERTVLTQRAVGPVAWELAGEEERESMVKRELWVTQNLADYKEEQEIKSLSKAEQKMYAKMKKKGSSSGSFLKED